MVILPIFSLICVLLLRSVCLAHSTFFYSLSDWYQHHLSKVSIREYRGSSPLCYIFEPKVIKCVCVSVTCMNTYSVGHFLLNIPATISSVDSGVALSVAVHHDVWILTSMGHLVIHLAAGNIKDSAHSMGHPYPWNVGGLLFVPGPRGVLQGPFVNFKVYPHHSPNGDRHVCLTRSSGRTYCITLSFASDSSFGGVSLNGEGYYPLDSLVSPSVLFCDGISNPEGCVAPRSLLFDSLHYVSSPRAGALEYAIPSNPPDREIRFGYGLEDTRRLVCMAKFESEMNNKYYLGLLHMDGFTDEDRFPDVSNPDGSLSRVVPFVANCAGSFYGTRRGSQDADYYSLNAPTNHLFSHYFFRLPQLYVDVECNLDSSKPPYDPEHHCLERAISIFEMNPVKFEIYERTHLSSTSTIYDQGPTKLNYYRMKYVYDGIICGNIQSKVNCTSVWNQTHSPSPRAGQWLLEVNQNQLIINGSMDVLASDSMLCNVGSESTVCAYPVNNPPTSFSLSTFKYNEIIFPYIGIQYSALVTPTNTIKTASGTIHNPIIGIRDANSFCIVLKNVATNRGSVECFGDDHPIKTTIPTAFASFSLTNIPFGALYSGAKNICSLKTDGKGIACWGSSSTQGGINFGGFSTGSSTEYSDLIIGTTNILGARPGQSVSSSSGGSYFCILIFCAKPDLIGFVENIIAAVYDDKVNFSQSLGSSAQTQIESVTGWSYINDFASYKLEYKVGSTVYIPQRLWSSPNIFCVLYVNGSTRRFVCAQFIGSGGSLQSRFGTTDAPMYVSIGAEHVCLLYTGGSIKCASRTTSGQNAYIGIENATGITFKAVVAMQQATCALDTSDVFHCWGVAGQSVLDSIPKTQFPYKISNLAINVSNSGVDAQCCEGLVACKTLNRALQCINGLGYTINLLTDIELTTPVTIAPYMGGLTIKSSSGNSAIQLKDSTTFSGTPWISIQADNVLFQSIRFQQVITSPTKSHPNFLIDAKSDNLSLVEVTFEDIRATAGIFKVQSQLGHWATVDKPKGLLAMHGVTLSGSRIGTGNFLYVDIRNMDYVLIRGLFSTSNGHSRLLSVESVVTLRIYDILASGFRGYYGEPSSICTPFHSINGFHKDCSIASFSSFQHGAVVSMKAVGNGLGTENIILSNIRINDSTIFFSNGLISLENSHIHSLVLTALNVTNAISTTHSTVLSLLNSSIEELAIIGSSLSSISTTHGSGSVLHLSQVQGVTVEVLSIVNTDLLDICSERDGGAFYFYNSTQQIEIISVTAKNVRTLKGDGGFLYSRQIADVFIQDSLFHGCESQHYGGAAYFLDVTDVAYLDTAFNDNIARKEGGGIYFSHQIASTIFPNVEEEVDPSYYANWLGYQYNLHLDGIHINNSAALDGNGGFLSVRMPAVSSYQALNFFVSNVIATNSTAQNNGGLFALQSNNPLLKLYWHMSSVKCSFCKAHNGSGGAIYVDVAPNTEGFLYVSNSLLNSDDPSFHDNYAGQHGGTIYVAATSLDVVNNLFPVFLENIAFEASEASVMGGAIYGNNIRAVVKSSFSSNQAQIGGAIALKYSELYSNNARYFFNSAFSKGGAVYMDNCPEFGFHTPTDSASAWGEVASYTKFHNFDEYIPDPADDLISLSTININYFKENEAQSGGAMYLTHCAVRLHRSLFLNNEATSGDGGAVNFSPGSGRMSILQDVAAVGNVASANGGFLFSDSGKASVQINPGPEYQSINSKSWWLMVTFHLFAGDRLPMNLANYMCREPTSCAEVLNIDFSPSFVAADRYVFHSIFVKNEAGHNGGALYLTVDDEDANSAIEIRSAYFSHSDATNMGGSLYIANYTSVVMDSVLLNKTQHAEPSELVGAGIALAKPLDMSITNVHFKNMRAAFGSAMWLSRRVSGDDRTTYESNMFRQRGHWDLSILVANITAIHNGPVIYLDDGIIDHSELEVLELLGAGASPISSGPRSFGIDIQNSPHVNELPLGRDLVFGPKTYYSTTSFSIKFLDINSTPIVKPYPIWCDIEIFDSTDNPLKPIVHPRYYGNTTSLSVSPFGVLDLFHEGYFRVAQCVVETTNKFLIQNSSPITFEIASVYLKSKVETLFLYENLATHSYQNELVVFVLDEHDTIDSTVRSCTVMEDPISSDFYIAPRELLISRGIVHAFVDFPKSSFSSFPLHQKISAGCEQYASHTIYTMPYVTLAQKIVTWGPLSDFLCDGIFALCNPSDVPLSDSDIITKNGIIITKNGASHVVYVKPQHEGVAVLYSQFHHVVSSFFDSSSYYRISRPIPITIFGEATVGNTAHEYIYDSGVCTMRVENAMANYSLTQEIYDQVNWRAYIKGALSVNLVNGTAVFDDIGVLASYRNGKLVPVKVSCFIQTDLVIDSSLFFIELKPWSASPVVLSGATFMQNVFDVPIQGNTVTLGVSLSYHFVNPTSSSIDLTPFCHITYGSTPYLPVQWDAIRLSGEGSVISIENFYSFSDSQFPPGLVLHCGRDNLELFELNFSVPYKLWTINIAPTGTMTMLASVPERNFFPYASPAINITLTPPSEASPDDGFPFCRLDLSTSSPDVALVGSPEYYVKDSNMYSFPRVAVVGKPGDMFTLSPVCSSGLIEFRGPTLKGVLALPQLMVSIFQGATGSYDVIDSKYRFSVTIFYITTDYQYLSHPWHLESSVSIDLIGPETILNLDYSRSSFDTYSISIDLDVTAQPGAYTLRVRHEFLEGHFIEKNSTQFILSQRLVEVPSCSFQMYSFQESGLHGVFDCTYQFTSQDPSENYETLFDDFIYPNAITQYSQFYDPNTDSYSQMHHSSGSISLAPSEPTDELHLLRITIPKTELDKPFLFELSSGIGDRIAGSTPPLHVPDLSLKISYYPSTITPSGKIKSAFIPIRPGIDLEFISSHASLGNLVSANDMFDCHLSVSLASVSSHMPVPVLLGDHWLYKVSFGDTITFDNVGIHGKSFSFVTLMAICRHTSGLTFRTPSTLPIPIERVVLEFQNGVEYVANPNIIPLGVSDTAEEMALLTPAPVIQLQRVKVALQGEEVSSPTTLGLYQDLNVTCSIDVEAISNDVDIVPTLRGTLTVTTSQGLAMFDDVYINGSLGAMYRFTFTCDTRFHADFQPIISGVSTFGSLQVNTNLEETSVLAMAPDNTVGIDTLWISIQMQAMSQQGVIPLSASATCDFIPMDVIGSAHIPVSGFPLPFGYVRTNARLPIIGTMYSQFKIKTLCTWLNGEVFVHYSPTTISITGVVAVVTQLPEYIVSSGNTVESRIDLHRDIVFEFRTNSGGSLEGLMDDVIIPCTASVLIPENYGFVDLFSPAVHYNSGNALVLVNSTFVGTMGTDVELSLDCVWLTGERILSTVLLPNLATYYIEEEMSFVSPMPSGYNSSFVPLFPALNITVYYQSDLIQGPLRGLLFECSLTVNDSTNQAQIVGSNVQLVDPLTGTATFQDIGIKAPFATDVVLDAKCITPSGDVIKKTLPSFKLHSAIANWDQAPPTVCTSGSRSSNHSPFAYSIYLLILTRNPVTQALRYANVANVQCTLRAVTSPTDQTIRILGAKSARSDAKGVVTFDEVGVYGPVGAEFAIRADCTWPSGESFSIVSDTIEIAPFGIEVVSIPESILVTGNNVDTFVAENGELVVRVITHEHFDGMNHKRVIQYDAIFCGLTPHAASGYSGTPYRLHGSTNYTMDANGIHRWTNLNVIGSVGKNMYFTIKCSIPDHNSIEFTTGLILSSPMRVKLITDDFPSYALGNGAGADQPTAVTPPPSIYLEYEATVAGVSTWKNATGHILKCSASTQRAEGQIIDSYLEGITSVDTDTDGLAWFHDIRVVGTTQLSFHLVFSCAWINGDTISIVSPILTTYNFIAATIQAPQQYQLSSGLTGINQINPLVPAPVVKVSVSKDLTPISDPNLLSAVTNIPCLMALLDSDDEEIFLVGTTDGVTTDEFGFATFSNVGVYGPHSVDVFVQVVCVTPSGYSFSAEFLPFQLTSTYLEITQEPNLDVISDSKVSSGLFPFSCPLEAAIMLDNNVSNFDGINLKATCELKPVDVQYPASHFVTMHLIGNLTQVSDKDTGIVSFPDVGVFGPSGTKFRIEIACRLSSDEVITATTSEFAIAYMTLYPLSPHPPSVLLPSKPTDLIPITPAPSVRWHYVKRDDSIVELNQAPTTTCILDIVNIESTGSSLARVQLKRNTTVHSDATAKATFDDVAILGPYGTRFRFRVTCTWANDDRYEYTYPASAFPTARVNYLDPLSISTARYGIDLPDFVVSITFYKHHIDLTPTNLVSWPNEDIKGEDIVCSVTSANVNFSGTTSLAGNRFSTYFGGTNFVFQGLSLSAATPANPTYNHIVRLATTCTLNDQVIGPPSTIEVTLENIFPIFEIPPPARIKPSYRLNAMEIVLKFDNGEILAEDNIVCTLSIPNNSISYPLGTAGSINILGNPRAITLAGRAIFENIGFDAPFGAIFSVIVNCPRPKGGVVTAARQKIVSDYLYVDWLQEPPEYILQRNQLVVSVQIYSLSPNVNDHTPDESTLEYVDVATCEILVEEVSGELELLSSGPTMTPISQGIHEFEAFIAGDPGSEYTIATVCDFGLYYASSPVLHGTIETVLVEFESPPPISWIPSTSLLLTPMLPSPTVFFVRKSDNSRISSHGIVCHTSVEGSAELLLPPLGGYRVQLFEEDDLQDEETIMRPIELRNLYISGDFGSHYRLIVNCARSEGDSAVPKVVPLRLITPVARWKSMVPETLISQYTFTAEVEIYDSLLDLIPSSAVDDAENDEFDDSEFDDVTVDDDTRRLLLPRMLQTPPWNLSPARASMDNYTSCILSMYNDDPRAFIQNNDATSEEGVVLFESASITARSGSVVRGTVLCTFGGVPIPSESTEWSALMEPCPVGYAPSGDNGYTCAMCPRGTYSDGGVDARCIRCPSQGVLCTSGILTYLDGYYRVDDGRNTVDEFTEFHPCLFPNACNVTADHTLRLGSLTHRCNDNYMGPLCAICDEESGYVRSGQNCVPCHNNALNYAITALVPLLFIMFAVWVSLFRKQTKGNPVMSIFRVLLTYVSVLGTLGSVYIAHGTATVREYLGFADSVGSSVFAFQPLQCTIGMTFVMKFILTVGLPFLIAASSVIINIIAIRWRIFKQAKEMSRKDNRILSTQTGRAIEPNTTPKNNRLSMRILPTARSAIKSLKQQRIDFKRELLSFHREKRWMAPVIFVLNVGYTSITTTAFSVFKCLPFKIDGRSYLSMDMRVECDTSTHTIMKITAGITIAMVSFGIPAMFAYILVRNKHRLDHSSVYSRFGFLYDGYAIERSLFWWESLVMVRKALVVAIGSVIHDEWYQIVACITLFILSLALQASFNPFRTSKLNQLETIAVGGILCTMLISVFYLRYQTIAAPCYNADPTSIADSTGATCEEVLKDEYISELGTSVALLTLNFSIIALLLFNMLRSIFGQLTMRVKTIVYAMTDKPFFLNRPKLRDFVRRRTAPPKELVVLRKKDQKRERLNFMLKSISDVMDRQPTPDSEDINEDTGGFHDEEELVVEPTSLVTPTTLPPSNPVSDPIFEQRRQLALNIRKPPQPLLSQTSGSRRSMYNIRNLVSVTLQDVALADEMTAQENNLLNYIPEPSGPSSRENSFLNPLVRFKKNGK